MVKTIIYEYKGRTFKGCVRPSFQRMGTVHFYEFKPNAKIWKWQWKDSFDFWIDDYDTIEEACRNKFAKMMSEEAGRIAIAKKWKEFEEKY